MINFEIVDRLISFQWSEFNSVKLPHEEYEWVNNFIEKYNEYVRKGLLWYDITVEEKKIYYKKLLEFIPSKTSIVYSHVFNCSEGIDFDKSENILINDIFKLQACIEDFEYGDVEV